MRDTHLEPLYEVPLDLAIFLVCQLERLQSLFTSFDRRVYFPGCDKVVVALLRGRKEGEENEGEMRRRSEEGGGTRQEGVATHPNPLQPILLFPRTILHLHLELSVFVHLRLKKLFEMGSLDHDLSGRTSSYRRRFAKYRGPDIVGRTERTSLGKTGDASVEQVVERFELGA